MKTDIYICQHLRKFVKNEYPVEYFVTSMVPDYSWRTDSLSGQNYNHLVINTKRNKCRSIKTLASYQP